MLELIPSRRKGTTKEASYLGWIQFFEQLAKCSDRVRVARAPLSWGPFIRYMGHHLAEPARWFPEDGWFFWNPNPKTAEESRRQVEVAAGTRPELTHALHLWDTRWSRYPEAESRTAPWTKIRSKCLTVASNGSFFRPEVLRYLDLLHGWFPNEGLQDRPIILCPSAADMPYPAPLHQAIQKAVPNCYLMVVTSVFGIVPEELWPEIPEFEVGLPYMERVYWETSFLFSKFHRLNCPVILYLDYFMYWVIEALKKAGHRFIPVFAPQETMDRYLDLQLPQYLERLQETHKKWQEY